MKGLLIKDYKLLLLQKKFYMAVILIAAAMVWAGTELSFIVTYLTFVFAYFTISTISYDELDNGMTFIMTLPITRKEYVKEKYVYGLVNTFASWLISLAVVLVIMISSGKQDKITEVCISQTGVLATVCIMMSVTIPISIIFGAAKGRVAMMVIAGICYIALRVVLGVMSRLSFDTAVLIDKFISQKPIFIGVEVVLLCAAVLFISYITAAKYVEKKEF